MKYKLVPHFVFVIIAIIVGVALFKLVNFKDFEVEKPALAAVYAIVLISSIFFMIKKVKNK